uniref:Siderophore-iron transporter Str1 n=1 Tax=Phaffia rhodozyma TaxID=264483 RepID=A0A1C9U6B2_PHARH|nr:siderophore-iron transporter Str1 [Phaffia rhodozyma]
MYYFSGYLSDAYWSSWLYIVFDYSATDYTYILNILTVGLCLFSVPAGLIQRYTHRFKYLQISGLCFRIIGMGLNYYLVAGGMTNAVVVTSRVFISLGGGISVISSQVASQASVPHDDLALAMAILSLWTSIGGAIGSAISASVWNRRVPEALTKYVGDVYNQTEIAEIFGSILVARIADGPSHSLFVCSAYNEAIRPLYLAALITSMVSLLFGICTQNYYLGDTHNVVEDTKIVIRSESETDPDVIAAKASETEAELAAKLNVPRS